MNILVTGGAGYIGSHCVKRLIAEGHNVSVIDDLSTGSSMLMQEGARYYTFRISKASESKVEMVLHRDRVALVMHFSANAYVGESVSDPLKYYANNIESTVSLLSAMKKARVSKIVYSSSCAVYGDCEALVTEDMPKNPVSPYGYTKLVVENVMKDCYKAHGLRSIGLRYFNAGGASTDGSIGEIHDPETHVIPLLLRSAMYGSEFTLYGDNYATADGSCIRDYVHVEDIADAHVRAINILVDRDVCDMVNLSANTCSVLGLADVVSEVVGGKPNILIGSRRVGDPPRLTPSNSYASKLLGWTPSKTIKDIVTTAYKWEKTLARKSN